MAFLLYGAEGASLGASDSFEDVVHTVAESGLYSATSR
jgi:hypothetical protein